MDLVGTVGAAARAAAAVEEFDVPREEGAQGRETDADYADVDLDYGPEAGEDVV